MIDKNDEIKSEKVLNDRIEQNRKYKEQIQQEYEEKLLKKNEDVKQIQNLNQHDSIDFIFQSLNFVNRTTAKTTKTCDHL